MNEEAFIMSVSSLRYLAAAITREVDETDDYPIDGRNNVRVFRGVSSEAGFGMK